jgi:adenosine deaminase
LFDIIKKITTDPETVYRCATHVIKDFGADNVRYLELRSTPKETSLMNKSMFVTLWYILLLTMLGRYIDVILKAIADCNDSSIKVKYLVSINREEPL